MALIIEHILHNKKPQPQRPFLNKPLEVHEEPEPTEPEPGSYVRCTPVGSSQRDTSPVVILTK